MSCSPEAIRGSHSRFSSSDPNPPTACPAKSAIMIGKTQLKSPRAISSTTTPMVTQSVSRPPYSPEMFRPKSPSFTISWTCSAGNTGSRSPRAYRGASSSRANRSRLRRRSSCSSVNEKSIMIASLGRRTTPCRQKETAPAENVSEILFPGRHGPQHQHPTVKTALPRAEKGAGAGARRGSPDRLHPGCRPHSRRSTARRRAETSSPPGT